MMDQTVYYDVSITYPAKNISLNVVETDIDGAVKILESAKTLIPEDDVFLKCLNQAIADPGITSYFYGKRFNIDTKAYRKRIPSGIKGMCGTVEIEYDRVGKDLICPDCGSLAPQTVLEIIAERGIEAFERSTKAYKYYIQRKDTRNASFGGIKYYREHDTPEFCAEIQRLMDEHYGYQKNL